MLKGRCSLPNSVCEVQGGERNKKRIPFLVFGRGKGGGLDLLRDKNN